MHVLLLSFPLRERMLNCISLHCSAGPLEQQHAGQTFFFFFGLKALNATKAWQIPLVLQDRLDKRHLLGQLPKMSECSTCGPVSSFLPQEEARSGSFSPMIWDCATKRECGENMPWIFLLTSIQPVLPSPECRSLLIGFWFLTKGIGMCIFEVVSLKGRRVWCLLFCCHADVTSIQVPSWPGGYRQNYLTILFYFQWNLKRFSKYYVKLDFSRIKMLICHILFNRNQSVHLNFAFLF